MIDIRGVTRTFGPVAVLQNVNLPIDEGELVCLIGASGSGRSTLLQCINGLRPRR